MQIQRFFNKNNDTTITFYTMDRAEDSKTVGLTTVSYPDTACLVTGYGDDLFFCVDTSIEDVLAAYDADYSYPTCPDLEIL